MTITYRMGTLADSEEVFRVFTESIIDLGERTNVMAITGGRDPQVMDSIWQKRKPMFEFLAQSAAQFWVAEQAGRIIAYARSIEHDGVMDLTEFFVTPPAQSGGVGRELLARAFQSHTAQYRSVIATLDDRALTRYMKAGVYARFPIKYFSRKAEKVDVKTDLRADPLVIDQHLADLNRIDRVVLGHARATVHRWLASARTGFVYRRKDDVVGYGYPGGPFALLNENDIPAALAHAESQAALRREDFGVETPLVNRKAIQYFMDRNYRMDSFTVVLMSNEPFGKFENYLCFTPIFFM